MTARDDAIEAAAQALFDATRWWRSCERGRNVLMPNSSIAATSNPKLSDVFARAAQRFDAGRWIQERMRDFDGRCCALGHMEFALLDLYGVGYTITASDFDPNLAVLSYQADLPLALMRQKMDAIQLLERAVNELHPTGDGDFPWSVGNWNDEPDRTPAQVRAVLAYAAVLAAEAEA